MSTARAVAYATLAVGVLDGLWAVVFSWLRGVAPARVFQSIAAGLLGREAARSGGDATALLGLGLHFLIAGAVSTTYVLASRRMSLLTRRPFLCGPVFGLLVYFVMYDVVIPLSALGPARPARTLEAYMNGFLAHILCVGLPAALVARSRGRADGGSAGQP